MKRWELGETDPPNPLTDEDMKHCAEFRSQYYLETFGEKISPREISASIFGASIAFRLFGG